MNERFYKVRVSEGLFEALADRVDWGEPDADGFYTPALYRTDPPQLRMPSGYREVKHDAVDGFATLIDGRKVNTGAKTVIELVPVYDE